MLAEARERAVEYRVAYVLIDVQLEAEVVDERFVIRQCRRPSALGNRGQANYSSAKAGLQGLTRTLAIELGQFGITVNAVAPGFIDTEMTRATARRQGIDPDQRIAEASKLIPVRRVGQPRDVANVICFLCSDEASFVSGQIIYVAGGPRG